MATKNFKGFQLITLTKFNTAGFTKDNDTLYFVRTRDDKSDGFLYFNGKKYGNDEQAKAELVEKYGDLKIGENNATIAEYVAAEIAKVNGAATALEKRVATIEGKGEGSIKKAVADEASRADAAEKKNAAAIATLNGNSGVTGSVDQKIQAALEEGAVTLEVQEGDKYLGVTSATTEGKGTVYTLASKADEIDKAIGAVKVSVASAEDAYVTASVDEAGRAITLSETVQKVGTSSADAKGLAEASDVKAYVDGKVSDKNVTAEGESGDTALVGASAANNKVTVTTTKKLKDAVAKAETSVQSVNGKASSAITLTGADIATNQKVGASTNATVNAVLADIYTKLGVVVKADGKTIKEADDHTLSVNLETMTDGTVAAGHVALEHGTDGALYGVMYYSGDDAE